MTPHKRFLRDKAPTTNTPTAPEVQDVSESSRADPYSVGQQPPERVAYITVDALKSFITATVDTILQQVNE